MVKGKSTASSSDRSSRAAARAARKRERAKVEAEDNSETDEKDVQEEHTDEKDAEGDDASEKVDEKKKQRKPQGPRCKWNYLEDEALIAGYAKYEGETNIWSKILKDEEFSQDLIRRSNVNIKDRMRNIGRKIGKLDEIKARLLNGGSSREAFKTNASPKRRARAKIKLQQPKKFTAEDMLNFQAATTALGGISAESHAMIATRAWCRKLRRDPRFNHYAWAREDRDIRALWQIQCLNAREMRKAPEQSSKDDSNQSPSSEESTSSSSDESTSSDEGRWRRKKKRAKKSIKPKTKSPVVATSSAAGHFDEVKITFNIEEEESERQETLYFSLNSRVCDVLSQVSRDFNLSGKDPLFVIDGIGLDETDTLPLYEVEKIDPRLNNKIKIII